MKDSTKMYFKCDLSETTSFQSCNFLKQRTIAAVAAHREGSEEAAEDSSSELQSPLLPTRRLRNRGVEVSERELS